MKRILKILASVFLISGLAVGIAISYSDRNDPDLQGSSTRFDDCPAYPTAKPIFEAHSGKNWAEAGLQATIGGQAANAELAYDLPRANFIDDYIFDAMAKADPPVYAHAPLCTDAEFMRRVYMDLTGRIPSAAGVKDFLADKKNPKKREQLVDRLLETPEYVDRMTMWFGDLFQIGFGFFNSGVSYGRSTFNSYLRQVVEENRSYDKVVADLLTASGDNWKPENGPVNFLARGYEAMANQYDVLDNIAAQSAKVFLGVPALCISCHSGAGHLQQVNTYLWQKTRRDLWGLAAFFSGITSARERRGQRFGVGYIFDEGLSEGYDVTSPRARGGVRPTRVAPPGQEVVPPKYFFTGDEPSGSDSGTWRAQLADFITSDPQFAKATVNYLWKEFFGMGIVDPPDAFDLARKDQATHPELLEALGDEFVKSGFDIKHMIELMVKSTTYQLSARFPGEWEGRYAQYFARRFSKRMTAEMLMDAIVKSSGIPNPYYVEMFPDDVREIPWAMQLPDTSEPRTFGSAVDGPRAAANAASSAFLNLFFRGNRDDQLRRAEGSVQQALALMNNPLVLNRAKASGSGLVGKLVNDGKLTNEQIVAELFLSTVSRYPTDKERAEALAMLKDRAKGAENLYLALVNKLDFIFY